MARTHGRTFRLRRTHSCYTRAYLRVSRCIYSSPQSLHYSNSPETEHRHPDGSDSGGGPKSTFLRRVGLDDDLAASVDRNGVCAEPEGNDDHTGCVSRASGSHGGVQRVGVTVVVAWPERRLTAIERSGHRLDDCGRGSDCRPVELFSDHGRFRSGFVGPYAIHCGWRMVIRFCE